MILRPVLAAFDVVKVDVLVPLQTLGGPIDETEALSDRGVHPGDIRGATFDSPGDYSNL